MGISSFSKFACTKITPDITEITCDNLISAFFTSCDADKF